MSISFTEFPLISVYAWCLTHRRTDAEPADVE